jgi:steroid 5-alpha reductase family enzyme
MTPLVQPLLLAMAIISTLMVALWLVGIARRDVSIVDPFWGAGFVIVAWLACALHWPPSLRSVLLAGLTTVWGLRLALHLVWRNWGSDEDRRYAAMRARHGQRFWCVSLITVFLLQAVILWFVAIPIQVAVAAKTATPLGWLDVAGTALWAVGLLFEAGGDWQLARFKVDPANAGRVLDRGLWRFTRHPNYFGDFCVWWGLYLIAAAGGAGWTVASPLLMTFLLLKVSGVTLLESTIADRRPDYSAYVARTNAFFPGPTKASPNTPPPTTDTHRKCNDR